MKNPLISSKQNPSQGSFKAIFHGGRFLIHYSTPIASSTTLQQNTPPLMSPFIRQYASSYPLTLYLFSNHLTIPSPPFKLLFHLLNYTNSLNQKTLTLPHKPFKKKWTPSLSLSPSLSCYESPKIFPPSLKRIGLLRPHKHFPVE